MNTQKTERGQALVLIILSIVGLLGFAALAVDMGQLYSERRRAQSAADAAALAAAYEAINPDSDIDPVWVGEDIATVNGFSQNGMDVWVEVNNPPYDGPYRECPTCNPNIKPEEYYQVKITRRLKPIFAQFIFRGREQFTVEAIAHARDIQAMSPGAAIHALSTDLDAIEVLGTPDIEVYYGNVQSNGGGRNTGKGKLTVTGANIYTARGWTGSVDVDKNKNTIVLVSPTPLVDGPLAIADPPKPDCDTVPAGEVTGDKNDKVFWPGKYTEIDFDGKDSNTMKPGMYCINGDVKINGNATVKGDGVFIVLLNGGIKNNGGSEIDLKRPNNLIDGAGNQWGGMLIYVPRENASGVDIKGNNGTTFTGTIFAPASQCDIGGTSDTVGYNASIICDKIKVHGNPTLTIYYQENQNYRTSPMVELTQ